MKIQHLFFLLALPGLPTLVAAQDPPLRASLRSSFFQAGSRYADVWGDGSVALVGASGQNRIDIVDVSNPDNATYLTSWIVPPPNSSVSTQDIKSANGLAYVLLAGGGPTSVQIVDVRNPANPGFLTNVGIAGFTSPHNIFVDAGWLYICNGSGDGIAMVDLTGYDPDNPPGEISTATYVVMGAGSVHDITAENELLWVSDISGSQKVFDASNLTAQAPSFLGEIKGGAVHSSWPTADGSFLVVCDESFGGPGKLMEVVDSGVSVQLVQRDSWVNTLSGVGQAGNPHNPAVAGNRAYRSEERR